MIDANQSGDGTYAAAAQKTQTLAVKLNPQTITFGKAPSGPLVGASGSVSASASSGLPVRLTVASVIERGVLDFGGSSASPATVSYVAAGSCVIDANQSGNGYVRGGGAEDADADGEAEPADDHVREGAVGSAGRG